MGIRLCSTALCLLLTGIAASPDAAADQSGACASDDAERREGPSMLQARQQRSVVEVSWQKEDRDEISWQKEDRPYKGLRPTKFSQESNELNSANTQDCNWECYLDRYADLQRVFGPKNTAAAEAHYIKSGQTEGRDCTCEAACDWQCYLDNYEDLQKVFGPKNTAAAAAHYEKSGKREGRDCTCSSCNWQCYLDNNADLKKVFGTNTAAAKSHYENHGEREGRDCTCKDDTEDEYSECNWQCYLDRYQNLKDHFGATNTAAAEKHFKTYGKKEGKDCTCPKEDESGCDWQCYLDRYADLRNHFGATNTAAAKAHYEKSGKREGRDCSCSVESNCNWSCYLDRYEDLQKVFGPTNTAAAEAHWTKSGKKEGRDCTCPETPTNDIKCHALPQLTGFDVSDCTELEVGGTCSVPCPDSADMSVQFECTEQDAVAGNYPVMKVQGSSASLLQDSSQHRLLARHREQAGLHYFGPQPSRHSLLTYFKEWVRGRYASKVVLERNSSSRHSLLEEHHRSVSTTGAAAAAAASKLLHKQRFKECPDLIEPTEDKMALELVQIEIENNVQHTLYLDQHGLLQHVAARLHTNGTTFDPSFDPPACRKRQPLGVSEMVLLQGLHDDSPQIHLRAAPLKVAIEKLAGEKEMLSLEDPVVQDCKQLFHRTVNENCQRDMTLKVISARSFIINGLAVELDAKVCNAQGECFVHRPRCAFQIPASPDASLLQITPTVSGAPPSHPGEDLLPEEEKGQTATVVMSTHICSADQKDGVDASDRKDTLLIEMFGTGEISRYKGNEHVNDALPKWGALEVSSLPSEVNFVTEYPSCFPEKEGQGPGSEIIRNQGECGSCWVFTTASAAMHNICISSNGAHSLRSADDRFEVSTQKIMSCPAEGKTTQYGCRGGNVLEFDLSARTWGLTKEVDNPYQCGGGNPLKHFEQIEQSCESFPWAGYCYGVANSNWFWGGAASVTGEYPMMTYISQGLSLYASIDTYANFVEFRGDGVYQTTTGEKKAGHALTVIGYGSNGGTPYWFVHNSWGTFWGDNGFAKYLRGSNLGGFESGAFVIRAWAEGAATPPCRDSNFSGILDGDRELPCTEVSGGGFGNLCEHPQVGEMAQQKCPNSCNTCVSSNGIAATPKPAPGVTTTPGPDPGPEPEPKPEPEPVVTTTPKAQKPTLEITTTQAVGTPKPDNGRTVNAYKQCVESIWSALTTAISGGGSGR